MNKVSIIIPTFNRRSYITIALDSVLAQTYKDYEIVVIDDGSSDDTKEVLKPYRDTIRYFYQDNSGIPATRNRGIKEAKGAYIAFLDSDDYWLPEKLERQLDYFGKNPHCGMVATRCSSIAPDGSFRKKNRPGKSGWVLPDLFKANFIRTSSAVIRKECLEEVELFDESLPECEEYDLWLRIAKKFQVGFIDEPLTVYTDNPHGISTNSLAGRLQRLKVLEKDYLKECIPQALYRKRLANNYHYVARHYLNQGEKDEGKKYLKRALSFDPLNLKYVFYYTLHLFK
jgi:glycosyltransferase involved in cell wall biosynthesis